jgi:hypothetical protein
MSIFCTLGVGDDVVAAASSGGAVDPAQPASSRQASPEAIRRTVRRDANDIGAA